MPSVDSWKSGFEKGMYDDDLILNAVIVLGILSDNNLYVPHIFSTQLLTSRKMILTVMFGVENQLSIWYQQSSTFNSIPDIL
jgi:hypothetical protein